MFLTQLTEILRHESLGSKGSGPCIEIAKTAGNHGTELLLRGFTLDQIVHDYGDLCQAVTELATEHNAPITNNEFQTFNRCLDNAIADAVSEFARERDKVIADTNQRTMNESLGFLAHEIRNLTNTSMLAVEALKRTGGVIAGSTGAILDRSLRGTKDLCTRALVDVRLRAGIPERRERVLVSEFVEEAEIRENRSRGARHGTRCAGGRARVSNRRRSPNFVGRFGESAPKRFQVHQTPRPGLTENAFVG